MHILAWATSSSYHLEYIIKKYHINFQRHHLSQPQFLSSSSIIGDKSCNKKWSRHQKTAANFLWPGPIANRVICHNCNNFSLSWYKTIIMMALVMTWQWKLLVLAWGLPYLAQRQGGVSTAQPGHHINDNFDDIMMIIIIIKDYSSKQPISKAFI